MYDVIKGGASFTRMTNKNLREALITKQVHSLKVEYIPNYDNFVQPPLSNLPPATTAFQISPLDGGPQDLIHVKLC